MGITNRSILSITDRQVVEFIDFIKSQGAGDPAVMINESVTVPLTPEFRSELQTGRVISAAWLGLHNVTVHYFRNKRPATENPGAQVYCATNDLIKIDYNTNQTPQNFGVEEALKLFRTIDDYLDQQAIRVDVVVGADAEATERHWLSALQSASAGQITRTDEFFKSLVEKFDSRIAEMEKQRQEQSAGLEKERTELRLKYEREHTELEEKRKSLRDADNTHERRAIRQEIVTEIRKRLDDLSFAKGAGLYATLIHWFFIGAIVVLATISINFALSYSAAVTRTDFKLDGVFIALTVKQILSVVGVLAFIVAYLRWLNSVYQKRAGSEHQLKQTQLDIERANWIVETLLEWRKAGQEPIPDHLMIAVTRGLFESSTAHSDIEISAADQLASTLLGTASKVKLNAGVGEFEWSGKDVARLKKE